MALQTRLMVWERTGAWARSWREIDKVRVHELRSEVDTERSLSEAQAAFLAIEVESSNWEARCQAALKWGRQYGHVRMVALSTQDLQVLESALREVGLIDVAYRPREVARLARLAQRHMKQFPSADKSLLEQWLARIPWTTNSTAGA